MLNFKNIKFPSNRYGYLLKYGLGILLVLFLIASYRDYGQTLITHNYQIFDIDKTITWYETELGILRKGSRGMLDNNLLSRDEWRDFKLSFDLINPRTVGLLFHYQDDDNYDFIFLNPKMYVVALGEKREGQKNILKQGSFRFSLEQNCVLKVKDGSAEISINDKHLVSHQFAVQEGKFGFVLNKAFDPQTIFHGVKVQGILSDGRQVNAQSPAKFSTSWDWYLGKLLPVYLSLIGLSIFLAFMMNQYQRKNLFIQKNDDAKYINGFTACIVHLIFSVFLFWPFISKGHVFVSSYDNIGEIFPLFFLSKHNFINIIQGQSWSLWNPFSHNGTPFYSNHWNMIYYPFNWIIFMFSDKNVLTALTIKTIIEVFFIGLCAYGFFRRELLSRQWALFCSIVYQLCSLLIFTLTIFPATSLYFAMTFYLFLLWSAPERRAVFNYVLLTLSVYLVLTSANVAFVFYACVTLLVVSIYRFFSVGKKGFQTFALVSGSFFTGLMLSAVRILPCFMGILESNRLVNDYYTIHDRFFAVIRFFVPEIFGRLGRNLFDVLLSENLHLVFKELNLPSNTQNVFFVYFGIIPALLLLISFVKKTKGGYSFWKVYSLVAIGIALLWQPFWGVFSILFFPLNHYSYHIIILPVGICALIGHTGIFLMQNKYTLKQMGKKFFVFLLLAQSFIFVFLTYLFPQLTIYTRLIFIFFWGGFCVFYLLDRQRPQWSKVYLSVVSIFLTAVMWILLFIVGTFALLEPLPQKQLLVETLTIPFLAVLIVIITAIHFYVYWQKRSGLGTRRLLLGLALLVVIPFLSIKGISSSAFIKLVKVSDVYQKYFTDVSLGYMKFSCIALLGILGVILARAKLFPKSLIVTLLMVVTAGDLLIFNFSFDNIAAPAFHRSGAYYEASFPYRYIRPSVKEKLDIVNYRVGALHKGGMNANKNLIFSLPSYSGIIGYMPKRFSKFISHFGYPEGTILISPEDVTNDQRFLDLSAVKYVLTSEANYVERPTALSRLSLMHSYEVYKDEESLLSRLKEASFDPRKKVLLSEIPDGGIPLQAGKEAEMIPIASSTSDMVRGDVDAKETAIVLFNESYDKGWQAYVDGKSSPVMVANYNFMACIVGPGKHEVIFRYEPKPFWLAVKISVAGFCIFVLAILWGLLSSRKKKLLLLFFALSISIYASPSSAQAEDEVQLPAVKNVSVGMPKHEFNKYYPKVSARTYRRTNGEQWITFDHPPGSKKEDMITFHISDDKIAGWKVNDRKEVVQEYLSEFCPPGFIKGSPQIYTAIKNALSEIPQDVFIMVTDRARPVLFTGYHYVGIGRFANSSDIFAFEDDAPTFMEGFTLIKLSFELELADSPDEIEGIILHEIAHKYLEHAKTGEEICKRERDANNLVKEWGLGDKYLKAKARFGHKEGENKICQ